MNTELPESLTTPPDVLFIVHAGDSAWFLLHCRYRPNAASGGWSYGRGLVHCREKATPALTSSH